MSFETLERATSSRCTFLHCYSTLMQPESWMSKWIRHNASFQTTGFAVPSFAKKTHFFQVCRRVSITVKRRCGVWVTAAQHFTFPIATVVLKQSGFNWKCHIISCPAENLWHVSEKGKSSGHVLDQFQNFLLTCHFPHFAPSSHAGSLRITY